jgi:hypothetical protein
MRKHTVFRPGDIELRPDQTTVFHASRLRWMISVNLTMRGVLLECEAQMFFQSLEPDGLNLNVAKTFVLLNTNDTQAGQRIKTVETQMFDARNGDETNLEPTLVGTGPVDYYQVTGISRRPDGVIAVQDPVVMVVFRTVSLMLEQG